MSMQLPEGLAERVRDEHLRELRDRFAAAALQGMLAAWPVVVEPLKFEAAAAGTYKYADAMLAERAK